MTGKDILLTINLFSPPHAHASCIQESVGNSVQRLDFLVILKKKPCPHKLPSIYHIHPSYTSVLLGHLLFLDLGFVYITGVFLTPSPFDGCKTFYQSWKLNLKYFTFALLCFSGPQELHLPPQFSNGR